MYQNLKINFIIGIKGIYFINHLISLKCSCHEKHTADPVDAGETRGAEREALRHLNRWEKNVKLIFSWTLSKLKINNKNWNYMIFFSLFNLAKNILDMKKKLTDSANAGENRVSARFSSLGPRGRLPGQVIWKIYFSWNV